MTTVRNGTRTTSIAVFNYEDPDHAIFTGTGSTAIRQICSGTSAVGWNTIPFDDSAFTLSPKRLVPPAGWPILWRDPAVVGTTSSYVYMATTAIPAQNVPVGGCIDTDTQMLTGPEPFVGGACIARSVDYGATFTVNASDCVHTASYDRYEESDLSSYRLAAFHNVPRQRIDVYRAASDTAPFTAMPDPFPGKSIAEGPRLHENYLIAADTAGNIWMQLASGAQWSGPAWPKLVGTGYSAQPIHVDTQFMERRAQYTLVHVPIYSNPGIVYVFYATTANGHAIIKGSSYSELTGNVTFGAFTIDPGTDVVHPAVAVDRVASSGGPSFSTHVAVTWLQSDGIKLLLCGNNPSSSMSCQGSISTPICPTYYHYWGYYDAHMAVDQPDPYSRATFLRATADSNAGCTERNYWDVHTVAVTAQRVGPFYP